jgi:hypothetical protein
MARFAWEVVQRQAVIAIRWIDPALSAVNFCGLRPMFRFR